MTNVPRIPSLPIAYREAEKLLRQLGGPRVPDQWQGGLPFSYHVGPGGAAVEMTIEMDEGLKPIYNVVAKIPGSGDQVVIVGNHRDAWTPGAVDPNSGTTAMLEAARALGAARQAGWVPARTILFCSWDAEEYGLVGSTEWAEDNASMLSARAVAYLNVDAAVTGPTFGAAGVPSLRDALREAAALVPEPREGGRSAQRGSVARRRRGRSRRRWRSRPGTPPSSCSSAAWAPGPTTRRCSTTSASPRSTSASGGRTRVYHAVYDNFFWMSKFGDPEFLYHQAAARLLGVLTMRVASADVAPLRFASYATALREDLDAMRIDVVRAARTAATTAFAPDFAPISKAIAESTPPAATPIAPWIESPPEATAPPWRR